MFSKQEGKVDKRITVTAATTTITTISLQIFHKNVRSLICKLSFCDRCTHGRHVPPSRAARYHHMDFLLQACPWQARASISCCTVSHMDFLLQACPWQARASTSYGTALSRGTRPGKAADVVMAEHWPVWPTPRCGGACGEPSDFLGPSLRLLVSGLRRRREASILCNCVVCCRRH